MKKNILLLIASAALLASCGAGNGSGAAKAPEFKEAATLDEVKASAKKAGEAIKVATGVSSKLGADLKLSGKAVIPAEVFNGKAGEVLTLNEKFELTGVNLDEKVSFKDNKLAASGSFTANLNTELDMPVMPDMSALYSEAMATGSMPQINVGVETKKVSGGLTAKDWIVDGKAYGDASGCYAAIKGIVDALPPEAHVELPFDSADDLKVWTTLPEGYLPEGNPLAMVGEYLGQIDSLKEGDLPEVIKLGKFSDGNLGAKIAANDLLGLVIPGELPEGMKLTLTGALTLTFSEAGAFNLYADLGANLEYAIPVGRDTNVKINAEGSFKFSAEIAVGDVTIDALPDVSSFKELKL